MAFCRSVITGGDRPRAARCVQQGAAAVTLRAPADQQASANPSTER